MSLTPPNSALLLISLTRISAIPSNEGNNSEIGEEFRGLMVLMPSIEIESILGLEPATDMLPLASTSTPGCVVRVVNALVEPEAEHVHAEPAELDRNVLASRQFADRFRPGGKHLVALA